MKVAYFDIETTNLDANMAVMITACIKPQGGKTIQFYKGRTGSNDKELVKAVRDELEKYDIIVGYYHLGFDIPFINSRLLYWNLKPLEKKLQIDVYRIAKKTFKLTSRRLAAVTEFLKIRGKTRIDFEEWLKAALDGDKKSIAYILEHNVADVEILERLLERLKYNVLSISRA